MNNGHCPILNIALFYCFAYPLIQQMPQGRIERMQFY